MSSFVESLFHAVQPMQDSVTFFVAKIHILTLFFNLLLNRFAFNTRAPKSTQGSVIVTVLPTFF